MADASVWQAGEDHGLVWSWGAALVSGAVGVDQASTLWSGLDHGADIGAFLEALSTASGRDLLSLPDFAIAIVAHGDVHAAARGQFVVQVDAGGLVVDVTGTAVRTWSERHLEDVRSVLVHDPGAPDGPRRVIREGTVPASAVFLGSAQAAHVRDPGLVAHPPEPRLDWAEQVEQAEQAEQAEHAFEPEPAEHAFDPEPADDRLDDAIAASSDVPALDPVDDAIPASSDVPALDPVAVRFDEAAYLGGDGEVDASADAGDDAGPEASAPPGGPIGAPTLSGAEADLRDGSAEAESADSVVPESAADGAGSPLRSPTPISGAWNEHTSLDQVELAAVRSDESSRSLPADGAIITGAPKAEVDAAAALRPLATEIHDRDMDLENSEEPGLHDGYTIAQFDESAPAHSAPAVQEPVHPAHAGLESDPVTAAFCGAGHPNQVLRTSCRICGLPVEESRVRIGRPSLGRVRGTDGMELKIELELIGPILIGRSPRADRVRGADIPQLLPLPYKHISANHLQLRLEAWSVLAVDMQSTNGTYLHRQGQRPTRLTPHDAVALERGDVLDLGHGIRLEFEDLP